MELIERLKQQGVKFFTNEPMAKHTSFKIGGPADILACPSDAEQLKAAVQAAKECGVAVFIMGNGSNLLVSDEGYRGMIVRLEDSHIEVEGNRIHCGAGALLSKTASIALEHSLAGFAFASGIPGSIGGAVRMNAGAYGGEFSDVVKKTRFLDTRTMETGEVTGTEHDFSYRHSMFCDAPEKIIVETEIVLQQGDKAAIAAKMEELSAKRREKQPVSLPSGGSTFKRPEGYYAAALIDQCGLRGFRIGGAEVSQKHTGFIVNIANATAQDVYRLMEHVRAEVYKKFSVTLQNEICIVGDIRL